MPPAQPAAGLVAVIVGAAFLFLAILIQVAIVRWLLRVNLMLEQLRQQTKALQDLRTQAWHTRRACEALAGIEAAAEASHPSGSGRQP